MQNSSTFKMLSLAVQVAVLLITIATITEAQQHESVLHNKRHNNIRPPRGYCDPISRAIRSTSRCYEHLVAAPARSRLQKNTDSYSSSSSSTSTLGQPPNRLRRAIAISREAPGTGGDELVYIRLETFGNSIENLSTQPINERLVDGLFKQLLLFDGPTNRANTIPAKSQSPQSESSADNSTNEIRLQIVSGEEERGASKLAEKCRSSMEKFLCRLAYPSCHFRRQDISALVRPSCREDCLLLRDTICPNVNWNKFSNALKQAIESTLESLINKLDLEVQGAPMMDVSRNNNNNSNNNRTHNETAPSDITAAASVDSNINITSTSSPHATSGKEDYRGSSGARASPIPSIHYYWPHEHSIQNCEALPPLRPASFPSTSLLLEDLTSTASAAQRRTIFGSLNPMFIGPSNEAASLFEAAEQSQRNKQDLHDGRHLRTRIAGNKWPTCSNAYLTVVEQARPQVSSNGTISDTDSDGSDYQGTCSKTNTGLPCQAWTAQWPHSHTISELLFDNMKDATNMCRNPGGLELMPWCYTMDKHTRWQYCNITDCN